MLTESARDFAEKVAPALKSEAFVLAPYTLISTLIEKSKGSRLVIGAQNLYFEEKGAYTGEISADMLLDIGVRHCIVGHSERRQLFGDTDEIVQKKVSTALAKGIIPILCCGESLGEKDPKAFVKHQVERALEGVSEGDMKKVIVAYEPIWAIGTGKTASADDADSMITHIRSVIREKYGAVAEEVLILYGGSVKPENIEEFMKRENIDGALVGGASLKPDSFIAMAEVCHRFSEQK